MQGEQTCAGHGAPVRCVLCNRPRSPGPGWHELPGRRPRCPTCSVDAVDTQAEARKHIPAVRADMAALGIVLDKRVRVTLVDTLSRFAGRSVNGLTHFVQGTGEVIGISVVSGLTRVGFCATVAHEIGHVWLVQKGAAVTEPVLVEGLCELFAAAWLKKQAGHLATAIREAMAANPDPVYGVGYRTVRNAVVVHGIGPVLAALCADGGLPGAC
jgi:hypothetical protein